MNYDENYWRRLAVEAQEQAAIEYTKASHFRGMYGRLFQGMAHETHLKMMARMHWAEVERQPSVFHKGHA